MHNFNHKLTGRYGRKHILTQRLFLYNVGKGFGNLEVNVGIEQSAPYIFEGFGYVDLGNMALPLEQLKRPVELIT